MRKMVASMDFPYAGREIKSGEEFEATPKDVDVLKLFGRAEPLDEPVQKRRYRRRDMRAQE